MTPGVEYADSAIAALRQCSQQTSAGIVPQIPRLARETSVSIQDRLRYNVNGARQRSAPPNLNQSMINGDDSDEDLDFLPPPPVKPFAPGRLLRQSAVNGTPPRLPTGQVGLSSLDVLPSQNGDIFSSPPLPHPVLRRSKRHHRR